MLEHKNYEVKAWITVRAIDEADALKKAHALIALVPDDTLSSIAIEEEGSVYETEIEKVQ